jgi:hypothetical protein
VLKIVRRGKKGIFQIVGKIGEQRIRESTGTDSEPHAEIMRARREAVLLEEALRNTDPSRPTLRQHVETATVAQPAPIETPQPACSDPESLPQVAPPPPAIAQPDAPPPEEPAPEESTRMFMSVNECRASLPIKISRRAVVSYIRAAGPEFYQEHRRQLFLSPTQWKEVARASASALRCLW